MEASGAQPESAARPDEELARERAELEQERSEGAAPGANPENLRSEAPQNAAPTGEADDGGGDFDAPGHVKEALEHPAKDQATIASERQDAITGDSGMFYEQEPQGSSGDSANTPHRTSAPPATLQSGVPLPEDRAAGVEPGPSGPREGPSPGTYPEVATGS